MSWHVIITWKMKRLANDVSSKWYIIYVISTKYLVISVSILFVSIYTNTIIIVKSHYTANDTNFWWILFRYIAYDRFAKYAYKCPNTFVSHCMRRSRVFRGVKHSYTSVCRRRHNFSPVPLNSNVQHCMDSRRKGEKET